MKSYIVVGLGRFGTHIALQLAAQGCEVLAIDSKKELVHEVADFVTRAVVADIRDKEVLYSIGAKDFDCAIVAIGSDLAASVLATMSLKNAGVPFVVCKANDATHREVLIRLGADRVVIPEQEAAIRTAKNLVSPNVFEYIELSDDCGIIELTAPEKWVGKSILSLNVRERLGVNIIAVKKGRTIKVAPGARYEIEKDDILVILGESHSLDAIETLW